MNMAETYVFGLVYFLQRALDELTLHPSDHL